LILEPIIDLVAVCHKKGIENVILSPGSRCAPLTIAFARHKGIHSRTVSDERSAGFIALGMAQQLEKPVALVCTSGSAAMNYFPAVAEAFFQEIPLLILTADRPPEWIDQYDGQTVFQHELYGKHVKKTYHFPDSFSSEDQVWHANRIINEAINLAVQSPAGPVHINIPLREPFYPSEKEVISFPEKPRIFNNPAGSMGLSEDYLKKLKSRLSSFGKILIVPGQQRPNSEIQAILDQLAKDRKVVVVTDVISNLQSDHTINLHDHWLGNDQSVEKLKPELIITFGKSIISKSLKIFLRNSEASHWHIQSSGFAKDTFQNLTRILSTSPISFLNWLKENLTPLDEQFYLNWTELEQQTQESLSEVFKSVDFGEYPALEFILQKIPASSKIHLANSMTVRYANFLGKRVQEIFCNRGTSGIDGSNSTAVGCTFTAKETVTLITGDMAFFYDRNAFWHNYTMPNLRIILLNNHAGGIFRLIDGPSKQVELQEFFETKQNLSAKYLAQEYCFHYEKVINHEELKSAMTDFYSPSIHPKLLEIETSSEKNASILKFIKSKIKENITFFS